MAMQQLIDHLITRAAVTAEAACPKYAILYSTIATLMYAVLSCKSAQRFACVYIAVAAAAARPSCHQWAAVRGQLEPGHAARVSAQQQRGSGVYINADCCSIGSSSSNAPGSPGPCSCSPVH
jgi:hypothetical protein